MNKIGKIKSKDSFLIDKNGKKIILKGFSIADPFKLKNKDKQDVKKIIEEIANTGANVVRIPIKPSLWQAVPDFLRLYIDDIVQECKSKNIYCVLDWHAIGNPIKNETRLKEKFYEVNGKRFYDYEVNPDILKKAWKEISERYGKEPHTIFEIFNEPAPGEKNIERMSLSALYWKDWKKEVETVIKIIRKKSKNLILISPIKWAYDLSKVAEDPLKDENIAYSVHPYPIHTDWKENFGKIFGKYPIVVTEWAFKEKTNEDFLRATKEDYGNPILEYLDQKSISWIAWCYDSEWGPKILNSFKGNDYTEWGKFIVNKLRLKKR